MNTKKNKTKKNNTQKKISNTDIAIIGIGLKVPGADNTSEFWDNIKNGKNFIIDFPENREKDVRYESSVEKKYDNFLKGGCLKEIDKFDYNFFKLYPKEASLTDPNQRLFLEVAWSCLEDAGYGGDKLANSNTGFYVGFSKSPELFLYSDLVKQEDISALRNIAWIGNLDEMVASRISYFLNLHGPSLLVNTACSSSLVALHLACQAIKNDDCDQAVVGGINIALQKPEDGITLQIESPDSRIRPFDNKANGVVWGEGVIAILIKSAAKAIKDNDNIYAVIKGSAINQDGKSAGITAPNPNAQSEVIRKAWHNANINPETISCIEAHGTGTRIGDSIEIEGLSNAFSSFTDNKQFCAIGSVKSNIGHLKAAAGLASLVKLIMALKNKEIPPTINFSRPNREINFENSPVYISDKLHKWESKNYPRRCGINSFGISGTNCHVILEEAPKVMNNKNQSDDFKILTISSLNKNSLLIYTNNYLNFLNNNKKINLDNFCYTANTGRGHYDYRLAIIFKNINDLLLKLNNFIEIKNKKNIKDVYFDNKILEEEKSESKNQNQKFKTSFKINKCFNNNDKIIKSKIEKLCQLYVKGADINWESFYSNNKYHKINIPTYPFVKNRCWVKIDEIKNNSQSFSEKQYPLLGEVKEKTGEKIVYSNFFDLNKFPTLKEHKVQNNHILVGTMFLELAIEAFSKNFHITSFQAKNILLNKPMIFDPNEIKEVNVSLIKDNNNYKFTISSLADNNHAEKNNNWLNHAGGILSFNKKDDFIDFDIEKLKKSNNKKFIPSNKISFSSDLRISSRWTESRIGAYANKNEALVHIKASKFYKHELKEYFFHPVLLDLIYPASLFRQNDKLYMPMHFGEINIKSKMPEEFYSYVKVKNNDKNNQETLNVDILLLDKNGHIFAEIKNYLKKKLIKLEKLDSRVDDNLYHKLVWVNSPQNKKNNKNKHRNILILKRKKTDHITNKILDKLNRENNKILNVTVEKKFKIINDLNYEIGNNPSDYLKLFQYLKNKGEKIHSIIHLLVLNENHTIKKIENLKNNQELGVLSLLRLTKALQRSNPTDKIDLILVANYADEVNGSEKIIIPENASFFGLGKVVSSENENIKCRCLDIDDSTKFELISTEINSDYQAYKTAFRNNKRYIEELQKINLDNIKNYPFTIKRNGVYIVTGGLGDIGREVCRSLALKNNATFILINRSKIPLRASWNKIINEGIEENIIKKIDYIKSIEKLGSRIICISADISSEPDMKKNVSLIRKKYGPIKGVVHAAGILSDCLIARKTEDDFQKVLKSKVLGTWLIDKLTSSDKLDFFILFSSVSALFGRPGQSDYVAANSYLDSFSSYRNKKGKNTTTISWPGWEETSMEKTAKKGIVSSLSMEQGVKIFDKLLNKKIENIIISEFDYNSKIFLPKYLPFKLSVGMKEQIESTKALLDTNKIKIEEEQLEKKEVKIKLIGKDDDQYSETEKKVALIWNITLGYEEINIFDDFFDIGGNSLLATLVLSKINKQFEGDFSVDVIFTYKNIHELAKHIDQKNNVNDIKEFVPFTGIYDWLSDNNIKDGIIRKNVIEVNNLKANYLIFEKAIETLIKSYSKIKISIYPPITKSSSTSIKSGLKKLSFIDLSTKTNQQKQKDITKIKQQIQDIKEKEIKLALIYLDEIHYKVIFSRNPNFINDAQFSEILKDFQYFYNLLIINKEDDLTKIFNKRKPIFTPMYSYPDYYDCSLTTPTELYKWHNQDKFFYKSLVPTMNFSCLPSYFIHKNGLRRNNDFNLHGSSQFLLGYNNSGIWNIRNLQNKKRATDYLNKKQTSILIGSPYYLPVTKDYKNDKYLKLFSEGKNLALENNMAIFDSSLKNKYIIYASNFNYFGTINNDDFWRYWQGISSLNDKAKNELEKKYPPFRVIEINNVKGLISNNPKLLCRLFALNVKEYFKNQIIIGKKNNSFKKIYFGSQVIDIYKKDVRDNLQRKDDHVSDIVLIDLIKRIEKSYLFLRDTLKEISMDLTVFTKDLKKSELIIKSWEDTFKKFMKIVEKNNIKYSYRIASLPDKSLDAIKFLSKAEKKELIKVLDKITILQNELFVSARKKLQELGYQNIFKK